MATELTRSDLRLPAVRAAEARDNARSLCGWSRQLGEENTAPLGSRLRRLTAVPDNSDPVSDQRTRELARPSQLVGRDPTIELAKSVLRRRYDLTGARAFDLRRHISHTRNRKLRDVARGIVASGHDRGLSSATGRDSVTRPVGESHQRFGDRLAGHGGLSSSHPRECWPGSPTGRGSRA